jgi:hypothetical protein
MINAQLTKANTRKITQRFPALYRLNHGSKVIVLFTGQRSGTVIAEGLPDHPIGLHSDNWVNCLETDTWELLQPGDIVTLTVE